MPPEAQLGLLVFALMGGSRTPTEFDALSLVPNQSFSKVDEKGNYGSTICKVLFSHRIDRIAQNQVSMLTHHPVYRSIIAP
jgi:hypothetical protein